MICTGAPIVANPLAAYLEFYQSWYRLNYDICRIWYGPMMDVYLGAVNEFQNKTEPTKDN
jgi:hypothetical protein